MTGWEIEESEICQLHKVIDNLVEKVEHLNFIVHEKDEEIESLQNRVMQLEKLDISSRYKHADILKNDSSSSNGHSSNDSDNSNGNNDGISSNDGDNSNSSSNSDAGMNAGEKAEDNDSKKEIEWICSHKPFTKVMPKFTLAFNLMVSLLLVAKPQKSYKVKNRVYVGGLTTQVTKEALYVELNLLFGEVVDIQILYHRWCAFVEFAQPSSCSKALARGHIEINGLYLSINKNTV
ncbi:8903_t:CDS:2 [Paraglomus occultum]|uniref:8903_t:CDS:1 n=1 Tax=Paraglomus occultum TaxID=144539 RepID=A0A9N8ZBT1_9GLOM|nr:8903_t:CDS:2 [Paraglomus occultum]